MDWTQTVTLGGTIIGYITAMSVFFYYLNEKTIKEWRLEHARQISEQGKLIVESENRHREDVKAIRDDMKEINSHWRELFTYMNNKIDDSKKSS